MQQPISDDLLRRAELFNEIVDIVYASGLQKPLSTVLHETPPPSNRDGFPPKIIILGHRLLCNGTSVDLSRRPIIIQLVRLFLEKGMRPLSRDEIIVGLYGHIDEDKCTLRYRESMIANVVKLISRARNVLTLHFTEIGLEVDWLVYDYIRRVWYLCRPRNL